MHDKYSSDYKRGHDIQKSGFLGNNTKSLVNSVHASLQKLRSPYIDLLYIHWWDYLCTVEEVMDALHNLVAQGKVLYLGISDAPAWVVTKANTYARMAGKTPFVVYQGMWSIMHRDLERDILPMCLAEGQLQRRLSVQIERGADRRGRYGDCAVERPRGGKNPHRCGGEASPRVRRGRPHDHWHQLVAHRERAQGLRSARGGRKGYRCRAHHFW